MVMGEEGVGAVGGAGAGGEAIVVARSVGLCEGALDSFDISSNDTSDSYREARLFCFDVVFCSAARDAIANERWKRGGKKGENQKCPSKETVCPQGLLKKILIEPNPNSLIMPAQDLL